MELLLGDRAGAVEAENRLFAFARFDGDDRAFDPFGTGSRIDNEWDAAAEFLHHGRGGGGRNAAKAVGAGRGNGAAELFANGPENRVGALANGDSGQPAGDEIGHVGMLRQNKRQRPGPEGVGEFVDRFRDVLGHDGHVFEVAARGDVDDERIERWPLLGGKNLSHSIGVEGICGQAVNGFGRQGDDFAGAQQLASLAHGFLHFVIGNLENSGLGHAQSFHGGSGLANSFSKNASCRFYGFSLRRLRVSVGA